MNTRQHGSGRPWSDAAQLQEPILLLYDAPTTNPLGEILSGTSFLSFLDKSNHTQETADFLRLRAGTNVTVYGHSDGTTQLNNAATILSSEGYYNDQLYVIALSSPVYRETFISNLSMITMENNIDYCNNKTNFVSTWLAGNQGSPWRALLDPFKGFPSHSPGNAYR